MRKSELKYLNPENSKIPDTKNFKESRESQKIRES